MNPSTPDSRAAKGPKRPINLTKLRAQAEKYRADLDEIKRRQVASAIAFKAFYQRLPDAFKDLPKERQVRVLAALFRLFRNDQLTTNPKGNAARSATTRRVGSIRI